MANDTAKSTFLLNGEQAKKELDELISKSKQLKEMMESSRSRNDLSGFKQAEQAYKDNEKAIRSMKKAVVDTDIVLKNLSGSTLKDLRMAQREIEKGMLGMKRGTDEWKKSASDLGKVKNEISSVKKEMGGAGSSISSIKGAYLKSIAAIGAGVAVLSGVWASVSKSYQAFAEQLRADKRLMFALKGNLLAFRELKKQADELQNVTGIPDETINQIQMLGVNSGKSSEQVKKITAAAIELSSVTGNDLQASYLALNKTLVGQMDRTLPRLDSAFKNLTEEQLKNGEAIELVLKKYQGTAAESASAMDKMNVAWSEFQESVGKSESGPINWLITKLTELATSAKLAVEMLSVGGPDAYWRKQDAERGTTESVGRFQKDMEKAQKDKARWKLISENGQAELNKQLEKNTQLLDQNIARRNELEKLGKQGTGLNIDQVRETIRLQNATPQLKENVNLVQAKKKVLDDMLNPVSNSPGGDDTKKDAEKRAREKEQAYKDGQDILQQNVEAEIAIMQDGYEKQLFTTHESYRQQREAVMHELQTNSKLTAGQKEQLNENLKLVDEKYVIDVEKLQQDRAAKELQFQGQLLQLQLDGAVKGSMEELQLKKQQLDNQMQQEITALTGTEEQKAQLKKAITNKYNRLLSTEDERMSLQFLDKKTRDEIIAITDAEQKKLEELRLKRDSGQISQKEYNAQLLAIQDQFTKDSLQIALDKAQKELDIIKASGADTTAAEEALANAHLNIQKGDTKKDTTKEKEEWSNKQWGSYGLDQAQKIADAGFQITRDKNQRELDDKLSALDKQREKELSNKHLTEAEKDKINKKYAAKEAAVKKAAWEKQHKADLAQAWVNMALMVGKAAINIWPVPAIPMMAAAALEGGLQILAVSKQKVPEFAGGRYSVTGANTGKSYTADYAGPAVTGLYTRPALVAETGQEMIIDPATTRNLMINFPDVIKAINMARGAGGQQVQGYADGRYPANASVSLNDGGFASAVKEFTQVVTQLKNEGVKGSWYLQDLKKIQDAESSIQSSTQI